MSFMCHASLIDRFIVHFCHGHHVPVCLGVHRCLFPLSCLCTFSLDRIGVVSLVGVGGIAGHGGAGHRSSAIGGGGGAGSAPIRMAARGAGSGARASSLGSETEVVWASAVIAGTSRSSLRVSGVCSVWSCMCVLQQRIVVVVCSQRGFARYAMLADHSSVCL